MDFCEAGKIIIWSHCGSITSACRPGNAKRQRGPSHIWQRPSFHPCQIFFHVPSSLLTSFTAGSVKKHHQANSAHNESATATYFLDVQLHFNRIQQEQALAPPGIARRPPRGARPTIWEALSYSNVVPHSPPIYVIIIFQIYVPNCGDSHKSVWEFL